MDMCLLHDTTNLRLSFSAVVVGRNGKNRKYDFQQRKGQQCEKSPIIAFPDASLLLCSPSPFLYPHHNTIRKKSEKALVFRRPTDGVPNGLFSGSSKSGRPSGLLLLPLIMHRLLTMIMAANVLGRKEPKIHH